MYVFMFLVTNLTLQTELYATLTCQLGVVHVV